MSEVKVNYYVPEPAETRSIMEILADLSVTHPKEYEEAIEKLIAEKGEEWFKNIRYDWSINGRPKQFMPEPRDAWRVLCFLAGRGFGKDLNPLTATLTANRGWTTLGDLEVGDYVFDENGLPTKVLATYDTTPSRCYRLHFDDGTYIESSSTHLWNTWTHRDRKQFQRYQKKSEFPESWASFSDNLYDCHMNVVGQYGPTVKTTQEIIDTFTVGARKDKNHCIPNPKPLQFAERDLLIDPLVVGLFVGDGIASNGDICGEPEDIKHILTVLEERGHIIEHCKVTKTHGKGLVRFRIKGLKDKCKQLNLLYNKHIPEQYLFASEQQRLDLLRGLYTTDGTVDKDGTKCEFSQSNYEIARDTLFLIRSLGMKGRMVSRFPTVNGVKKKENWRVYALPTMDLFILPRKSERLDFECSQQLKRRHRMICKYEEIDPMPMRCITVDSPNSLWLVGEQLIPTHNTRTGAEIIRQVVDEWKGVKPMQIGLIAPTASAVNNIMVGGPSGIMSVYPEKEAPRWVSTSRKIFWHREDGTVKAVADLLSGEEVERFRGFNFDFAWIDELCLTAGTMILTDSGEVPIEKITTEHRVWTRAGVRPVLESRKTKNFADIWEITIGSGKKISGTARHPIWVIGEGWKELSKIVAGDRVVTYLNQDVVVSVRRLGEPAPVYNLEVADMHEYYANSILTHNCSFRYQEAWDMLMFCMRSGDNPQVIVTTTPKPVPILLDILKLPGTWTVKGSSYENRSNLAASYFTDITAKYEGSPLGRQELEAEIIEEIPNALWSLDNINKHRINFDELSKLPEFLSVVLAIDPAAKSTNKAAETGMCVAAYGEDDHFYILHLDGTKEKPEQWAKRALRLFDQYNCDRLIAEINNGGDMVASIIQLINPMQKVTTVHASRSKQTRAEPIASLYQLGRVHHVGEFKEAEHQMSQFSPIHNPHGLKDKCLVAGTQIITDCGTKNIEDIKIGDNVLTRTGYKKVLASECTNENAKVMTVKFNNGASLTGTPNHPIFMSDGSIKDLGVLRVNESVMGAFSNPAVTEIFKECGTHKVYNLTVEDNHEYFANGILTHNCDALVWALTFLVNLTHGRSTYAPAVGGSRQKLDSYKSIFRY